MLNELSKWPTEWEKKEWGKVNHSFLSDQFAVSRLEVVAGTRCSRHTHKKRANLFFVFSGCLLIQEWSPHNMEMSFDTQLPPGGVHIVHSGILHRFCVIESGKVLETYWSDDIEGVVSLDDIDRLDEGGIWKEWDQHV